MPKYLKRNLFWLAIILFGVIIWSIFFSHIGFFHSGLGGSYAWAKDKFGNRHKIYLKPKSQKNATTPEEVKKIAGLSELEMQRWQTIIEKISPYHIASVPVAHTFQSTLGASNGAFTYCAQDLFEFNQNFQRHHLGEDFNGIGGDNTDFGDAVRAIGAGKVIFRGYAGEGWGNVVMLAHRIEVPQTSAWFWLVSFYGHLSKVKVAYGEVVGRGQVIGEVGSANGRYLAHLHFEMRIGYHSWLWRGYSANLNDDFSQNQTDENFVKKKSATTEISDFLTLFKNYNVNDDKPAETGEFKDEKNNRSHSHLRLIKGRLAFADLAKIPGIKLINPDNDFLLDSLEIISAKKKQNDSEHLLKVEPLD